MGEGGEGKRRRKRMAKSTERVSSLGGSPWGRVGNGAGVMVERCGASLYAPLAQTPLVEPATEMSITNTWARAPLVMYASGSSKIRKTHEQHAYALYIVAVILLIQINELFEYTIHDTTVKTTRHGIIWL